jgi:antirestriction protein ArdC
MDNAAHIIDKFTIDELLHRSWKHTDSKAFFKFFDFIASFHHYSRFNTMLVYLQNEAVTFFGGTAFWKKRFNRTIKEDARPYVILAPMMPVMMVYDVMETEGEDSPDEFLKKGLGSKPFEVIGKLNPVVLANALQIAKKHGIKIIFKDQSYFKGGHITTIFSGKLEIALNSISTTEERFSVLIHELAHLFLGHTGHKELSIENSDKKIKLMDRKLSRTAEELEAETVSFLLCKKLGLETRAAEYIAAYITNKDDLIKFSYESVIKMADKIEDLFLKQIGMSKGPIQQSLSFE